MVLKYSDGDSDFLKPTHHVFLAGSIKNKNDQIEKTKDIIKLAKHFKPANLDSLSSLV